MVSVSFAKRAPGKENKDTKRRKERDVKMENFKKVRKPADKPHGSPIRSWSRSRTPSGKRTPLQDEPMWSPDHLTEARIAEKPLKSPEVIDLDVIMVTPPPQEPILISDSEDEGITRLPPDLGTTPVPPVRPQGPKTPPEPAVKFTLSSKQVLKPITNPLRDDEEEEEEEPPAPARGPNTPPGPPPESDESVGRTKSPSSRVPRSPAGSPPGSSPEPDVYDPFEPTKSPSPPGSPQQEPRVSSSDQTETVEKGSPEAPAPKAASPPPLPAEPPEPEERPPEPQKPPEEEATSTVPPAAPPAVSVAVTTTSSTKTSKPSSVPSKAAPANTSAPVVSTPVNPITQIFPGLPANVANILYPAALAAAVRNATTTIVRPQVVQTVVAPDFSRPPPAANILNRPPPMTIIAPTRVGEKTRASQNGRDVTHTDVVDMDLDSPNSPDSSDVSDIFEPPSPHSTHQSEKPSPKKTRNQTKTSPVKAAKGGSVDKFDSLFGSGARPSRKHSTPHKHKHGKKAKPGGKKDGNEEDIPNSAVDLQVKEKFLKKVQRQERVVEEVKLSLKPFYNKKTIDKDDYKDIMRKCVQKVCHNRSGEINPTKIRGLVQGYIKKVKYYRKKLNGPAEQAPGGKPTATDPPPPGFAMITKVTKPPTPIKSKA